MKGKDAIILLVWFGVVLVTGLAGFMVKEIIDISAQNKLLAAELSNKVEEEESLAVVAQELRSIDVDRLSAYMPKGEAGVAEFARQVEGIAASEGVELTIEFEDFPEAVDMGGRYLNGLGVSLRMVGNYAPLSRVVDRLVKMDYFVRMDRMLMTRGILDDRIDMLINGFLLLQ